MEEFKNKTVLITGAGRGIGKRLALGFGAAGARVGLLARSRAELELTQLEIEHAGGSALRLRADVRDFEQVKTAVERVRAHYGPVQILICSAGMQGPIGMFLGNSIKQWVETIETNLIGTMHCCAAVIPEMIERRSGKIITLSGRGASRGRPYFSAYATSKAGICRFVETLSEELRDHNVQINCMAPGSTYTHMTDEILKAVPNVSDKDHEDAVQVRVTGGTPPDRQIALAQFLASERSNHVSGKIVSVHDDWKKLERSNVTRDIYTLRRVVRT